MFILNDLYAGDIRPCERMYPKSSEYEKSLTELVEAGDKLAAELTPLQMELFERFTNAQVDVSALTDCETFCYGFRVGAKIMLDVLTEEACRRAAVRQDEQYFEAHCQGYCRYGHLQG